MKKIMKLVVMLCVLGLFVGCGLDRGNDDSGGAAMSPEKISIESVEFRFGAVNNSSSDFSAGVSGNMQELEEVFSGRLRVSSWDDSDIAERTLSKSPDNPERWVLSERIELSVNFYYTLAVELYGDDEDEPVYCGMDGIYVRKEQVTTLVMFLTPCGSEVPNRINKVGRWIGEDFKLTIEFYNPSRQRDFEFNISISGCVESAIERVAIMEGEDYSVEEEFVFTPTFPETKCLLEVSSSDGKKSLFQKFLLDDLFEEIGVDGFSFPIVAPSIIANTDGSVYVDPGLTSEEMSAEVYVQTWDCCCGDFDDEDSCDDEYSVTKNLDATGDWDGSYTVRVDNKRAEVVIAYESDGLTWWSDYPVALLDR